MTVRCNLPFIDDETISYVDGYLESGYLAMGRGVEKLEGLFADYTNRYFSLAFGSETAALDAYFQYRLNEGDEVIVSPYTYHSVIFSIIRNGGVPVFVDIYDNYDMNILSLIERISSKTKVIIITHLFGKPDENTKEIIDIANTRDIYVIEDCAQAIGAEYYGEPIGSCDSDAAFFSLYATKNITAIEGGIMLTGSSDLYYALKNLRNNGYCVKNNDTTLFGTNRRMSDIHAAVGISQFPYIKDVTDLRNVQAELYRQLLKLPKPELKDGWRHAYHHFSLKAPSIHMKYEIYDYLKINGIEVGMYYTNLINQDKVLYRYFKEGHIDTHKAKYLSEITFQLPLGPCVLVEDQLRTVELIKEVLFQ